MGNQLGIIAGSGEFPFLVLKEAQKSGYRCIIAGIKGEAETSLQEKAEVFEWFDVDEVSNLIFFLKTQELERLCLQGKLIIG